MIIAIDFDGTCVDHRYPAMGEPVPDAILVLRTLIREGHLLILNTMRSDKHLWEVEEWFKTHDIKLHAVYRDPDQINWTSSPKCFANLYVDDAAVGCPRIFVEGFSRPCVDWIKVLKLIREEIERRRKDVA